MLVLVLGASVALAMDEPTTDVVLGYALSIAFDLESHLLKGTAILSVPAGQPLELNLHGLEVTALDLNGKTLPSSSELLKIKAPSSTRTLTIHYKKSITDSPSDVVGQSGIALTGLWHPLPDRPCRFALQAIIPKEFEAVSEADEIQQEVLGFGKRVVFIFAQPVVGIHFAAGPYQLEEETIPGTGVVVASYFFLEDKDLAAHYRQKAKEYIGRYESLLAPYPYKRFSIVENRFPTGYAMPSLTLLGQAVVRLPFIVDTSLGHEVLHSWFGNAVDVDRTSGNWCEGLTTYLADQAYAEDEGKGIDYRKGQLLKNQEYVHGEAAIALKDFVGGDGSRTPLHLAHNAVGYGKAAMLFHMLAQKVGQENFTAAIRDFYQRQRGKTASWADIEKSFTPYGPDMEPFFDQWLNRVGLPELSAKDLKVDEVDGDLRVTFTLQQSGETPYVLDVPYELNTTTGHVNRKILFTEKEQRVEFTLADYPVSLVIDPHYDLARQLSEHERPPTWDWFKGAAKKIAVVGSPSDYDLYEPLIDEMESQGAEVIAANEVDDKQLSENAVLFLGVTTPEVRALFSQPTYPDHGFVVDVRRNPLNPAHPAVLVSASGADEVRQGMAKLRHYGKYCFLQFEQGRALEKEVCSADDGIGYGLEYTPVVMEVAKTKGFAEIVDGLMARRVIYVGESHTRYADHKLQLRIIREMHQRDPQLAIGMEMFPHAAQAALDQFIAGEISEKQFLKDSHYFEVWSFDYRLYREILLFARSRKIPVVGLNIDKKYVSKVYKEGGVSALGPEELMELPVDRDLDVPGYRERIYSVFSAHPGQTSLEQFNGFFQAQAIWDETMAENIVNFLNDHEQQRMVVIAGRGHVVKDNAIPPRVKRRLDVAQAIILNSDGGELSPPEVDYVVFSPEVTLPQKALMGIVMNVDKESKQVMVEKVAPNTPAEKGGVHKDDVLLALDDEPVQSVFDVKIVMLDKKVGDSVTLKIQRKRVFLGPETLTIDVKL